MSTLAIAFIGCGDDKVRADHIESYSAHVNAVSGVESVDVSTSRRSYIYNGTLDEFEALLRKVFWSASP